MLISTSRKPSQKTRKFCKNLARVTGSTSVNRGKMNMRELLLKALELEEINLAIVNEIKGNPSKITFYSNKGEVLLAILISVTLDNNEKLNMAPSQLKVVSGVESLNVLSDILGLPLVDIAEDNFIVISKADDLIAKIGVINKFGDKLNFQINVKKILEAAND
ncbi:ribonucleotide-diphosphate reductase subunit beta [Methanobrevibacter sp.]